MWLVLGFGFGLELRVAMHTDLVLIKPRADHRLVRPRAEGLSQTWLALGLGLGLRLRLGLGLGLSQTVEATREHEHPEAALAKGVACEREHIPNEAEQQLILLTWLGLG